MTRKDSAFIDLGTVTMAHKAQKHLEGKGIVSTVGRRTATDMSQGCRYGLWISGNKKEEAVLMLRASSFKIL